MRNIQFQNYAFHQYSDWVNEDKKIFAKIRELIAEAARIPFEGKGKPEPLKHNFKGLWSRRISE